MVTLVLVLILEEMFSIILPLRIMFGVGVSYMAFTGWDIDLEYCDIERFALEMDRDHSVVFQIAPKYCILGFFIDYDGYFISSNVFLHTAAAAAAKSLQSPLTLCDPIDGSPPGSPNPRILQANTGVGCHLLQCMKAKSESEVTQSLLTGRYNGHLN